MDLNNSSVWPCSCSSLCDNERDPLGPRYLPVSDSHNTRQTDNLHTEAGLWLFLQFYIFCTLLNIYPRQLLENYQLRPLPALAPARGIRKKVTFVASCSERVLFRFFPRFAASLGLMLAFWCRRRALTVRCLVSERSVIPPLMPCGTSITNTVNLHSRDESATASRYGVQISPLLFSLHKYCVPCLCMWGCFGRFPYWLVWQSRLLR